jgi:mono/diheme cytochrome c family protein
MRERIAIGLSLLTTALLVLLAGAFAARQNPPGEPPRAYVPATAPEAEPAAPTAPIAPEPAATPAAAPADSARGREVFARAGCARCHSVDGVGNRRYPLDGVGARLGPAGLWAWTVGDDAVRDGLSPSALRSKQRYRALPADEREALLAYLAALRGGR